jgi:hypothetical protein
MTGPTPPDDLGFEDPGFDALDTAIGERLRAVAPTAPNVDTTLTGLRPGFARARRRHQAVVAGAAALCVAAFVGIGAVVFQGGGTGDVKTPPATRPDTTTTAPTTAPTTVPTTPPTSGGTLPNDTLPGGITPGTVDDHGGGDDSGPGGGSDDSGSGSSDSSGSGSSGSGSSGSGSGTSGGDG